MPKRDGRQRSSEDQEKLRRRAITMWEGGMKPTEISMQLGVCLASLYNWRARYQDGGNAALKSKPRRGALKKVDEARMKMVAMKLIRTFPNQHGYVGGLWTKALIGLDLARKHNLNLSRWTLGRLCRELGLQPEHCDPREWIRQSDGISSWAKKSTSELQKNADDQHVGLYLANLYPIKESSPIGKVWSSDTPSVKGQSGCCMMSAVALRGDIHFIIVPHVHTDTHFRRFIDQLMIGQKGRVILVARKELFPSLQIAQKCVREFPGALRLFMVSNFEAGAAPSEIR